VVYRQLADDRFRTPSGKVFRVLSSQQSNQSLKKLFPRLRRRWRGAFSRMLLLASKIWLLYVLRAGETGVLDVVLLRLAVYLEKIEALRRRIKGA
jgi:type II secretory pathway component PulF